MKTLTIEKIKKQNKIFFDNATFHGDKSYTIPPQKVGYILEINTALTGRVRYEVSEDGIIGKLYQNKY